MPVLKVLGDESYDRLWLSSKALGGGIWDYDLDTDELYCNARWYELVGAEAGTIRCIADFKPFIHPDDVATATEMDEADVERLIRTGERYQSDFRVVTPRDGVRHLRSVACVIRDEQTGHRRAVGCVTNYSDLPTIEQSTLARSPAVAARSTGTLSTRERECLGWVSLGKTAWETAIIMGRSRRTVEFHLRNATKKLSATNKTHAAVIAITQGLL